MIQCGYHLSKRERAKYRSDANHVWESKFEYLILPSGRWAASRYKQDPFVVNESKTTIEQLATEFGTKIFLDQIWVEGPNSKIEADKWVLPPLVGGNLLAG